MTDRISLAARNNALWCDVVARSHGITGTIDELAWTAARRTPPYYPDAVTLSPDIGEYDVLARVDSSDGCSVKDSWARLDLSVEDFACLVTGTWVWLEPREAPAVPAGLTWCRVETVSELGTWTRAWASDPDAEGILRAGLLAEPGVHLLAAREGGNPEGPVLAGAILNLTGEVAGVSNLFTSDGDTELAWRSAAAAARDLIGAVPLVGWEAGESVDAAVAAGCEPLGPLSVWLR